ncbi:metalloproteinase inhibitor 1-like [Amphiura filiformis]|uniref:metalloproteinase inhibitor 1-like n=1 Tax=Amphiura filiformis TaxID=82378 RepID=UPI003B2216AF
MDRISAILVGFLLVLGQRLADGCTCMPAHPQEHFCRAGFAIKGTILSKKPLLEPGMNFATHLIYKVQLDKVFKGEDSGLKGGDVMDIKTATMDSMCGNTGLAEGKSYLLTGNAYSDKFYHSACNLATEWQQVSVFQRKGLRNFYRKSCGECEIRQPFGYYYSDTPVAQICSYNFYHHQSLDGGMEDCEAKYSTCLQKTKGSCNWLTSPAYDECVLNRDIINGDSGSGFL